jgi:hypothetical protein
MCLIIMESGLIYVQEDCLQISYGLLGMKLVLDEAETIFFSFRFFCECVAPRSSACLPYSLSFPQLSRSHTPSPIPFLSSLYTLEPSTHSFIPPPLQCTPCLNQRQPRTKRSTFTQLLVRQQAKTTHKRVYLLSTHRTVRTTNLFYVFALFPS